MSIDYRNIGADRELITDPKAIRERIRQLQLSSRELFRGFDTPPYVGPIPNTTEIDRLDKGVGYRIVYARQALAKPARLAEIVEMMRRGEQARMIGSVPTKLAIADNHSAAVAADPAGGMLVVKDRSLVDVLTRLFEMVWVSAVPIPVDDTETLGNIGGRLTLAAEHSNLMRLLASGLTDSGIGRHMGMSRRTVQRRVRELMDHYGVKSRFQLGMRAYAEMVGHDDGEVS